jgi:hypothetical protein
MNKLVPADSFRPEDAEETASDETPRARHVAGPMGWRCVRRKRVAP